MTDNFHFFELFVLDFLIPWLCNVNYEAGLFFIVDQHDVRLIVRQMLVGLDGKVSEDHGMIVPDQFFWLYPPVFTMLKVVLSTYGDVYYRGHIVVSLSTYSVAAAADGMCHGLCMLLAQPASRNLHSVIGLEGHCFGFENLLCASMIRASVFALMLL